MRIYKKNDFPVSDTRSVLEPGPIVLVTSAWKGRANIMTMGWQTVMEFTPSLVGCVIAGSNHSFGMIHKSGECVINVPTSALVDTVVGIGNCSGGDVDKFEKFGLTTEAATKVEAPLIGECFASFECRLADGRLVNSYNFFIFEIIKAHVAVRPKYPKTLHYHGHGIFSESGRIIDKRKRFTRPGML